MIGQTPHATVAQLEVADGGPPALLKRVGNVVEAQLVRCRLEAVGIPSFAVGADAFRIASHSGVRQIEIWVPQAFVDAALDELDTPREPYESFAESAADADFEDPGRPLAFRALASAICGWIIVFAALPGVLLSIVAFAYALVLAGRGLQRSTHRDRGFRLQIVAAVALALIGLVMTAFLLAAQL